MAIGTRTRDLHLRDEAREALDRAFAARFVWTLRSPALLLTSNMRVVLLCATERQSRFTFHFSQAHADFLQAGPTERGTAGAFVALACGSGDSVFVLPYRDWRQWTDGRLGLWSLRRLGDRHVLEGPPRIELARFRVATA